MPRQFPPLIPVVDLPSRPASLAKLSGELAEDVAKTGGVDLHVGGYFGVKLVAGWEVDHVLFGDGAVELRATQRGSNQ
ncbi:MAG: hypothetical protein AAF802_14785 [Planctomycetota bacterium]